MDIDRRPKLAWYRVKAACAPLVALLDSLPAMIMPGESVTVAVHAISDLPHALADATVMIRLADSEGRTVAAGHESVAGVRAWRSGLDADSVRKVDDLVFAAPDTLGPLTLELSIHTEHHGRVITSKRHYHTLVVPPDTGST